MKVAPFHYHAPASKQEALDLLARYEPEDARILAGGQSLIPMMAFRLARPGHLIDINRIPGLDGIDLRDDAIYIGAIARHAAFEKPIEPGPTGRLLADVAAAIGHAPIRSRGTFCGSLANADPASEWCMTATALGARMRIEKSGALRELEASEFFFGIMTTALEADEMLTGLTLPRLPADARHGFYETSRRAGDFALGAALAIYRLQDGRMQDARIVLAGAEPHPRRLADAEACLNGEAPSDAAFRAAAEAAANAIDPLTDGQVDAGLRCDIARAVCHRALLRSLA